MAISEKPINSISIYLFPIRMYLQKIHQKIVTCTLIPVDALKLIKLVFLCNNRAPQRISY